MAKIKRDARLRELEQHVRKVGSTLEGFESEAAKFVIRLFRNALLLGQDLEQYTATLNHHLCYSLELPEIIAAKIKMETPQMIGLYVPTTDSLKNVDLTDFKHPVDLVPLATFDATFGSFKFLLKKQQGLLYDPRQLYDLGSEYQD
jgi:hypothetical protein